MVFSHDASSVTQVVNQTHGETLGPKRMAIARRGVRQQNAEDSLAQWRAQCHVAQEASLAAVAAAEQCSAAATAIDSRGSTQARVHKKQTAESAEAACAEARRLAGLLAGCDLEVEVEGEWELCRVREDPSAISATCVAVDVLDGGVFKLVPPSRLRLRQTERDADTKIP